jgi:hypothetical protein
MGIKLKVLGRTIYIVSLGYQYFTIITAKLNQDGRHIMVNNV